LFEKLGHFYQSVLKKALNFSGLVVTLSLVLFVLSLFLVIRVRQEFIPPQDQNLILLSGQMPPGTSLEVTDQAAQEVEKVLAQVPEIQNYLMSVGSGGGGSTGVNQLFAPINLIS